VRFYKYQAVGNDYLVLDPADYPGWTVPDPGKIRLICHRNLGAGSDGILWGPLPAPDGLFGLRIFNPDGSEAEKSGNGTRIFARYLWDRGIAKDPRRLALSTPGGVVRAATGDGGRRITMDMGSVSFASAEIPVDGPSREVVNEVLRAVDTVFSVCAATIGNPHCVITLPDISPGLARQYGPSIETHPLFPRRTNVQFMKVLDRANIRIEIWERGAGYTLSSGTSSSASAAVAHRLGLVDRELTVHMAGGTLDVRIGEGYAITMTGAVTAVCEGVLLPELFTARLPE
jgi:diaminopimelate epimerase